MVQIVSTAIQDNRSFVNVKTDSSQGIDISNQNDSHSINKRVAYQKHQKILFLLNVKQHVYGFNLIQNYQRILYV